jgi:PhnB protein
MPQLHPYLSFSGNCREAMTFYQSCLGGHLSLQPFAETPMAGQIPAEAQQNIVHSSLATSSLTILASDASCMRATPATGKTVALCLSCGSDEEITRLFSKLGEGGTIQDPLAIMFWGGKFGALTDQFGTKWIFNYEATAAHQSPAI